MSSPPLHPLPCCLQYSTSVSSWVALGPTCLLFCSATDKKAHRSALKIQQHKTCYFKLPNLWTKASCNTAYVLVNCNLHMSCQFVKKFEDIILIRCSLTEIIQQSGAILVSIVQGWRPHEPSKGRRTGLTWLPCQEICAAISCREEMGIFCHDGVYLMELTALWTLKSPQAPCKLA